MFLLSKKYVLMFFCQKIKICSYYLKIMSEMMQCTRCGEILPRSKLERMKTGTYRRVCNHCKWLYYVKPSRERRILRELEARRKVL